MSSNHEEQNLCEADEVKLTAFALNQLDGPERTEVEAMLLRSERARQFVQETTRWAGQVREAYRNGPSPQPLAALRESLETEHQKTSASQLRSSTMSTLVNRKRSLKSYLIGLSIVGGVAAVLFALLLPAIKQTRETASTNKNIHPQIEQAPKSVGVSRVVKPDGAAKLDKQEKIAFLVDEFNRLVDEQRYEEAQVTAKRSAELFPKEPVIQQMAVMAKFITRAKNDDASKSLKEKEFLNELHNVEVAAVPFNSSNPYVTPEAKQWERLSRSRARPERKGTEQGVLPSPYYLDNPVKYGPKLLIEEEEELPSNNAPNTEQYDPIQDNAFLPVAKEPLSTFSIDVDTASFANVRRFFAGRPFAAARRGADRGDGQLFFLQLFAADRWNSIFGEYGNGPVPLEVGTPVAADRFEGPRNRP